MIERYSLPKMKRIWEEENKFRVMRDIEVLVCEALSRQKKIPASSYQRTDTTILTGGYEIKIILVRFRNKGGIWIKIFQHSLYARFNKFFRIRFINIEMIQFTK